MISITYGIIEEKYTLGDETRISYGIAVYSSCVHNETTTIIASIHDITSDKEKLLNIANECNRLGLSMLHFYDVIEDFLTE